jgi:hypothetical protein
MHPPHLLVSTSELYFCVQMLTMTVAGGPSTKLHEVQRHKQHNVSNTKSPPPHVNATSVALHNSQVPYSL